MIDYNADKVITPISTDRTVFRELDQQTSIKNDRPGAKHLPERAISRLSRQGIKTLKRRTKTNQDSLCLVVTVGAWSG